MITVYKVVDGGTDGLDRHTIATFTTEEAARKVAKGKGTMGFGDGSIYEETVYESWKDYEENSPQGIKKRALAKLSSKEKEALGIK